MVLSSRSQNAIRAVAALARGGLEPQVASRLAESSMVPRPYILKLLGVMARRGLLEARRGPRGGYRLKRDPASISLADIVDIFEDRLGGISCMLVSRPCGVRRDCAAHSAWLPVLAAYGRFLERTTVADLLGGWCGPKGSIRNK